MEAPGQPAAAAMDGGWWERAEMAGEGGETESLFYSLIFFKLFKNNIILILILILITLVTL